MSTRELTAVMLLLGTGVAHAGELGEPLSPALGRTPDVLPRRVISPDGAGLPEGSGSVVEGRTLYQARCASCHGTEGRQPGNALAGGVGSLASDSPQKTVGSFWPYATTLWDYIHVAMPYGAQRSLSADETYAVTAYVLHLNGILDAEASLDRDSLPTVVMPNAAGFDERWH